MCHPLFLASSLLLPLLRWNVAAPGLTVGELDGTGRVVRDGLTGPEVYRIRSHVGCACPFILEVDPATASPDERWSCTAPRPAGWSRWTGRR